MFYTEHWSLVGVLSTLRLEGSFSVSACAISNTLLGPNACGKDPQLKGRKLGKQRNN